MGFSKEAKELMNDFMKQNESANKFKEYRCPDCDDIKLFEKDNNFYVCPDCGSRIYRG